jgi:uridine kinase
LPKKKLYQYRTVKQKSLILAVSGGTGSGKSWLTERLVQSLGSSAAVVQTDWYYRDQSHVRGKARLRLNFDHPRAIEVPLLVSHLKRLRAGAAVDAPRYDYATHRRLKRTVSIQPRPIVIVEGLFVLHEVSIRGLVDYGIFIDTPADQRLILRLKRDREVRRLDLLETVRLYEYFARPMHEQFVEPSRRWADEIWRGLPTEDRIGKLIRRLKNFLRRL